MTDKKKKPYNIMRAWKMAELSSVDNPAQEGARKVLMKCAGGRTYQLLSDVEGHSHIIDDSMSGGDTSYMRADGDEYGHSHPWIKDSKGKIIIGAAEGHTHEIVVNKRVDSSKVLLEDSHTSSTTRKFFAENGVSLEDGRLPILDRDDFQKVVAHFDRFEEEDQPIIARHLSKRAAALSAEDLLPSGETFAKHLNTTNSPPVSKMDKDKNPNADLTKRLEDLEKQNALYKSVLALNVVEKAHYDGLGETEKDAFLKKSPAERLEVVNKAKEENPVIFKSADGVEFRKNDDPRLVEFAKKNDSMMKAMQLSEQRLADQTFTKRASEELNHLPGDETAKVALLKAVDKIENETVRKSVGEMLKANNEKMALAFKNLGNSNVGVEGGPVQKLEALAEKMAKEKNIDIVKARVDVLETPDGKKLYEEMAAQKK